MKVPITQWLLSRSSWLYSKDFHEGQMKDNAPLRLCQGLSSLPDSKRFFTNDFVSWMTMLFLVYQREKMALQTYWTQGLQHVSMTTAPSFQPFIGPSTNSEHCSRRQQIIHDLERCRGPSFSCPAALSESAQSGVSVGCLREDLGQPKSGGQHSFWINHSINWYYLQALIRAWVRERFWEAQNWLTT